MSPFATPGLGPGGGEVGMAKRPRQARDLQRGVALGRVDRPFGDRLVDFAADVARLTLVAVEICRLE
jgi:hypothetical protein